MADNLFIIIANLFDFCLNMEK